MDKCVVPVVPVDTLRFDVNAHSMENTMRVALAVPAHNGDENMACSLMNDAHREENTAHVKRDKDSRFVPVGAAHFADDHPNAVRVGMVRFVMNDARVLMENDVCFVQVANKHFVDDNDPLLDHVNEALTVENLTQPFLSENLSLTSELLTLPCKPFLFLFEVSLVSVVYTQPLAFVDHSPIFIVAFLSLKAKTSIFLTNNCPVACVNNGQVS